MPHPIPTTAREFLGVPFAHQGRSRYGLDCLGLLILTAETLNLRFHGQPARALDEVDYSHRPNTQLLYQKLASALTPTDKAHMRVGDIALMRIEGRAQHLGIIGDYPGEEQGQGAQALSLIHAYAPARKVVEHRLCAEWHGSVFEAFRF